MANAMLRARCEGLRTLLLEREALLNLVLSMPISHSDDGPVLRLAECEAQAFEAANNLLETPVSVLGDLYDKFSAFLLLDEVFMERPSLIVPLVQQICIDVQNVMAAYNAAPILRPAPDPTRDEENFKAAGPSSSPEPAR